MGSYDGVFIARHDYEVDAISRQLSSLNKSGDRLIVITKKQEEETDLSGAVVIRDVCQNKEHAIYLDHSSNVCRHGFAEDIVPESLDNGEKDFKEEAQTKNEEKKEPIVCDCCNAIMLAGKCEVCGHEVKRKRSDIKTVAGELKAVEVVDQSFYSGLLFHSRQKGYADGWARHKYREKFGVFPTGAKDVPILDERVSGYIKHLNIKRSKSKAKNINIGKDTLKNLLEKFSE